MPNYSQMPASMRKPTPVPTPIGPGFGNYGKQDVYIAPKSTQSFTNATNQRAAAYVPPVLGASASQGGGGGNAGGGGSAPSGTVDPYANLQQQQQTGDDQINRDYENFMSQLSGSEQGLNTQAANATSNVDTNYAPVKTALQAEGATKLQGLAEQGQGVQNQEKSAMMQSRDLYRQIQQQNIAQMAGAGISSSSVTEALAENLGIETARRIGAISQNANDIYINLAKEKTNVETYVKQKLVDMETKIAQEKSNITYQLGEGLRQINEARATAATQKANLRADLLQKSKDAMFTLQQQQQTFQQSLEQWKVQNTTALNAASNKDYSQQYANNLQSIEADQPLLNKLNMQGEYTTNSQGQMTKKFTNKKPTDEDTIL